MASAQTDASATIQLVSDISGVYTYDLTLTDTGTTQIGTFWYAWVPGEDFLPATPFDISSPFGWSLNKITGSGNSTDGSAIRWEATDPLEPGQSLNGFEFSIDEPSSVIYGDSPYYDNPPIGTSFVYEDGPFRGGSASFVATPVPGPPSAVSLLFGACATFVRRQRLKKSR
jgi:hypothetical protein